MVPEWAKNHSVRTNETFCKSCVLWSTWSKTVQHERSPNVKPKHCDRPLVVDCTITPLPLTVIRWDLCFLDDVLCCSHHLTRRRCFCQKMNMFSYMFKLFPVCMNQRPNWPPDPLLSWWCPLLQSPSLSQLKLHPFWPDWSSFQVVLFCVSVLKLYIVCVLLQHQTSAVRLA